MRQSSVQSSQQMAMYNKYEDTFDVFINLLIRRAPTVFVLINMTLMIWLVQTIYSSRLDSIPRSIYFFTPHFSAQPITNLYTSKSLSCKQGFQKMILKTFPSVKDDNIKKTNLTNWDQNPIVFCAEKGKTTANFSRECSRNQTFCSGYCVDNVIQCPITSIKKIHIQQNKTSTQYEQLYLTSDGLYKYIISRQNKNSYVVGLSAQYQERCANDYKYFDKYDNFAEYWNQTQNCGEEGVLSSDIYRVFDQMPVQHFLLNNNIWSKSIQKNVKTSQVYLGTINLIKFNNETVQCNKAQALAGALKNYLVQDPVKPTFTKSMLIIAFIFFTLSWAWLIGYYCFSGSALSKNKLIILMLTIELIVISFLYSQNKNMFETQQVITQIAACLQTQIQASSHWAFGITNSSPFKIIMYICTTFLLLQIVAQLIDRFMYVAYYPGQSVSSDQRNRCVWP